LHAAGVDLAEVRATGRFLSIDAATALASFSNEDGIDPDAFHRVIGGAVRTAVETGRPVRAYGEMVALLWNEGNVTAAIELETLWNDLGRELPFSLFCSYHRDPVSGLEHSDALAQICHLHSSVVETPPDLLTRGFDACVTAPRAARRWIAECLQELGRSEAALNDAMLVVSELATNAVIHAQSAFSVTVRAERSAIHIAVEDGAPVGPMVGAAATEPMAESGRGLLLVAAIASQWGVEPTSGGGKRVWAQLPA
jgi:anti-sigma regulatory factor (Ser/Thr protein kinase)